MTILNRAATHAKPRRDNSPSFFLLLAALLYLATSITHLPFGPIAGFTYGNGIVNTRTYDLDYRMTGIKDNGGSDIQYSSYTWNAGNNLTGITDNVTPANNQTLTYDAVDRLASAAGVYGTVSSITYDSNSNRLTYGATSYTVPSTSNKMSNAGGSAITYSSTGNITAIGTTTMTYNNANQMATNVVSGTTSTYNYDAFGQRLKVKVGAGTQQVMSFDQSGLMLTETNSGAETDYVYLDGMPVYVVQPATSILSAIHPGPVVNRPDCGRDGRIRRALVVPQGASSDSARRNCVRRHRADL